jgi:cation transport ATPase
MSQSGIISASVSFENKTAVVTYDLSILSSDDVVNIVEGMGYEAKVDESLVDAVSEDEKVSHAQVCTISIHGQRKQLSAKAIEDAVLGKVGVKNAFVSEEKKICKVVYDPAYVAAEEIAKMISLLGYKASVEHVETADMQKFNVSITNMRCITCSMNARPWCKSCVDEIESAVRAQSGVHDVKVWLKDRYCKIVYNPVLTDPKHLTTVFEGMGYETNSINASLQERVSNKQVVVVQTEVNDAQCSCTRCRNKAVKEIMEKARARKYSVRFHEDESSMLTIEYERSLSAEDSGDTDSLFDAIQQLNPAPGNTFRVAVN